MVETSLAHSLVRLNKLEAIQGESRSIRNVFLFFDVWRNSFSFVHQLSRISECINTQNLYIPINNVSNIIFLINSNATRFFSTNISIFSFEYELKAFIYDY